MAILKSSLLSDIRGSIGGTTYARNKAGLYARNRSKPVNPNTENQSRVRAQFSVSSFGFSDLNADQVAAWNQFAQGYPAVNKLGDTYTPSGRQMYMLCNQNLQSVGEDTITVPPYEVPVVPSLNPSDGVILATTTGPGAGPLAAFTFTDFKAEPGLGVIVYQATPNMQASRQSYRNRMRQLGFALQGTVFDAETPFNNYFGTPNITQGQIINARLSVVDVQSGVASAWYYFQVTVTDAP